MTIAGFYDDSLKDVLSANLTPSDFIRTPERLFGRARNLLAIERALSSAGRQIFIYGDRGVGKTSLALTAAHIHTDSVLKPIHVNCGRSAGFYPVVQAVGNAFLPPQAKFEHAGSRASIGGTFAGFGGNYSPSGEVVRTIALPASLNDALDIIKYIDYCISGKQIVVVIDEMERISNVDEKDKFAEFIKNLSIRNRKY